jgi:hypothetical protein
METFAFANTSIIIIFLRYGCIESYKKSSVCMLCCAAPKAFDFYTYQQDVGKRGKKDFIEASSGCLCLIARRQVARRIEYSSKAQAHGDQ